MSAHLPHVASRRAPSSSRLAPTAVILAGMIVVACSNGSTASTAPSIAQATATPTASPDPTPTPTPSEPPGDLALAVLADPKAELQATLEGTLDIGTTATIGGSYEQDGPDFHLTLDTTVAGVSFTTEQINAGRQTYLLTAGRPWRHDIREPGASRAPTLAAALATVDTVDPVGRADIGGATVQRFDLEGLDVAALTSSMGLSDPDTRVSDTSVALYASRAGVPVALDLTFTVPGETRPSTWDLRLTFDEVAAPVSVTAPEDPWIQNDTTHGYSIWSPEDWDVDLDTDEGDFTDFYSGDGAYVVVYCVPDAGLDLEEWVADGREFYTKDFGAKPDEDTETTIGDVPVHGLVWNDVDVEDVPTYVMSFGMVVDDTACDVQWFREVAASKDLDELFPAFLGTFSLLN